jgi:hypothetical protein
MGRFVNKGCVLKEMAGGVAHVGSVGCFNLWPYLGLFKKS